MSLHTRALQNAWHIFVPFVCVAAIVAFLYVASLVEVVAFDGAAHVQWKGAPP